MEQVSLFLIDPHTLFREGLRGLFSGTQFDVTHEASDLPEGLDVLKSNGGIGIVIFDFSDDGSDGELQMLKQMRAANEDIKLIVLTSKMSARLLTQVLNAGADAYLLKSLSKEALVVSLRLVDLGEKVFPTELATMITNGKIDPTAADARASTVNRLSEREREIVRCLPHGHSNKVIARQLSIRETTVKVHLKSVMRKINVNNRTQAAVWAIRNGLSGGV